VSAREDPAQLRHELLRLAVKRDRHHSPKRRADLLRRIEAVQGEVARILDFPVVIRRRDPANDNAPKAGDVTIDPDAIPEEVMDRLAIEFAKALADLEFDRLSYE
jgi:hypothetical protein